MAETFPEKRALTFTAFFAFLGHTIVFWLATAQATRVVTVFQIMSILIKKRLYQESECALALTSTSHVKSRKIPSVTD